MGVSIREVIEAGGYDLTEVEDARWLLSKQSEFEHLIEEAKTVIEQYEDFLEDQRQDMRLDVAEYQSNMEED